MSAYRKLPLGRVLARVQHSVPIEPHETYKQVTVRLFHKGVVLRGEKLGSAIRTTTQWRVRCGQILLSRIDARNGAIGIVPAELDGAIVTNDFWSFAVNCELAIPEFLDAYFGTAEFVESCKMASEGTTNRVRLQPDRFLKIEAPLPPLAEQRRIVARIEELSHKIETVRVLRDSALTEVSIMPESFISGIFDALGQFSQLAIGALGREAANPVQTGPFGAQLHTSEFVEEGVPVLNVGNVWPEGLRFDRLDHVLPGKAEQLKRYALRSGDLLFARSGATLGKVCLVPDQCDGWLMTGHLFRVRFDNNRCLPQFAFVALRGARSVRDQVFDAVRGATRPGFNTTLLSRIRIPLPSLHEQQCIVSRINDFLRKIDAIKQLQIQSAAELDALRPSVLSKAFRGEL